MTVEAAEPRSLLRRLYDWCLVAAHKPHALWTMGAVSFAESSFFPVPPDVMLIPMALARPERAARLQHWCAALRLGGCLAHQSLWIRRQGRGISRSLCPMGRLDHSSQGAHADPVQGRDDYIGIR